MIFAKGANYRDNDSAVFAKSFFNDIPVIAACAMLSKLENNIRVIENSYINFCHSKTIVYNHGYEVFSIILGQSSSCVKGGDNIEITGGVGAFSVAAQPKFTVDGQFIPVDENGVMVYKFNAPPKAGNYNKHIVLEYVTPDGTRKTIKKDLEYKVIEEK